jgi:hypothetical protein
MVKLRQRMLNRVSYCQLEDGRSVQRTSRSHSSAIQEIPRAEEASELNAPTARGWGDTSGMTAGRGGAGRGGR